MPLAMLSNQKSITMAGLKSERGLENLATGIREDKKLSIQHCKKILNRNGNEYTDEQAKKIRDFLYSIAEMDYEHYKTKKHAEESHPLHPGIYRRTG
jgi:hypothetical protein